MREWGDHLDDMIEKIYNLRGYIVTAEPLRLHTKPGKIFTTTRVRGGDHRLRQPFCIVERTTLQDFEEQRRLFESYGVETTATEDGWEFFRMVTE